MTDRGRRLVHIRRHEACRDTDLSCELDRGPHAGSEKSRPVHAGSDRAQDSVFLSEVALKVDQYPFPVTFSKIRDFVRAQRRPASAWSQAAS